MAEQMNTFEIELAQPEYKPGDTVKGHVKLFSKQAMKIHGVSAWIACTELIKGARKDVVKTKEVSVYGEAKDHKTKLDIPNGSFSWPFSFELPEQGSPPSLSGGDNGLAIEWAVHAHLSGPKSDKVLSQCTQETSQEFRVLTIFSATDPNAASPSSTETKKSKLEYEIGLNKSIYFPGEEVIARVHVTNMGKKTVEEVHVNLVESWGKNAPAKISATINVEDNVPIEPYSGLKNEFSLIVPTDAAESVVNSHGIQHTWVLTCDLILEKKSTLSLQLPFLVASVPRGQEVPKPSLKESMKSETSEGVTKYISETSTEINTVSIERAKK